VGAVDTKSTWVRPYDVFQSHSTLAPKFIQYHAIRSVLSQNSPQLIKKKSERYKSVDYCLTLTLTLNALLPLPYWIYDRDY